MRKGSIMYQVFERGYGTSYKTARKDHILIGEYRDFETAVKAALGWIDDDISACIYDTEADKFHNPWDYAHMV